MPSKARLLFLSTFLLLAASGLCAMQQKPLAKKEPSLKKIFSSNKHNLLFLLHTDGNLQIIDRNTKEIKHEYTSIHNAALSPEQKDLVLVTSKQTFKTIQEKEEKTPFNCHLVEKCANIPTALSWNPNEKSIAIATGDFITIKNHENKREISDNIPTGKDYTYAYSSCIAYGTEGDLACGKSDGTLHIKFSPKKPDSCESDTDYPEQNKAIKTIKFLPNKRIALCVCNEKVYKYDIVKWQNGEDGVKKLISTNARDIDVDPKGRYIAIISVDNKLKLVKGDSNETFYTAQLDNQPTCVTFIDEGSFIAIGLENEAYVIKKNIFCRKNIKETLFKKLLNKKAPYSDTRIKFT